MPTRDAGTAGNSLTCYATAPAPRLSDFGNHLSLLAQDDLEVNANPQILPQSCLYRRSRTQGPALQTC